MIEGRVTAKLQSFLLSSLPNFGAEKKPEFNLGVADTKLGARIFRVTNIPCICDPSVLELIRGVHLHFDALTQFPEPCNLDDEDRSEPPAKKMKKAKSVPLLKYEFRGCMVEDLKKGRTKKRAATLMDMVSIHYTVTRMKDGKLLLDTTTLGDPVKFCLGTRQVIYALDLGICGMFVRGERRFVVPVPMGYETKSGRGTKGINGPKGASGHRLVIDVTLVAVHF